MRLPFPSMDELPDGHKDIFDKIEASRGRVPDLFRLLAYSPAVLERREAYGKALRQETILDSRLRELAICTVARLNGGGHEYTIHLTRALEQGCTQEQLNALADFETSQQFSAEERAVMHYAAEVTIAIKVEASTWAACASFLGKRELIELVLTCAWYNQTARVTWPLELHLK